MSGQWLQFVAGGLTVGAIYALVALGFSIVYNASDVINFAQGEFVMIGGMSAVDAAGEPGLPLPLAVARSRWWPRCWSACCSRSSPIEPARHAGTVTLIIITIGASIFLRGLAQLVLGQAHPRAAGVLG